MARMTASETKALAGIAGMAEQIEEGDRRLDATQRQLDSVRGDWARAQQKISDLHAGINELCKRNAELEERMYGGVGRSIASSFVGEIEQDMASMCHVIRLESRGCAYAIHNDALLDPRQPLAVITDGVNLVVEKMAEAVRKQLMDMAVRHTHERSNRFGRRR